MEVNLDTAVILVRSEMYFYVLKEQCVFLNEMEVHPFIIVRQNLIVENISSVLDKSERLCES